MNLGLIQQLNEDFLDPCVLCSQGDEVRGKQHRSLLTKAWTGSCLLFVTSKNVFLEEVWEAECTKIKTKKDENLISPADCIRNQSNG